MRDYKRVSIDLSKGGRTKQSFQFEGDPNTLMKQFSKSGDKDIFKVTQAIARHGDFSEIPDFFSALLQVQAVQEEFESLPSKIRNAVNNSPEELFELLTDPARIDEAIELKLIPPNSKEALDIPLTPVVTAGGEAPSEAVEHNLDGSVQGGE